MSTTYIPKKPCKRCGTSLRFKSNYGCAECLRVSNAAYQAKNRDELLLKKRQWAKDNPEKNRAQSNKWQAENGAKAYAIQQRAKKANPDYYRLAGRLQTNKRRAALLRRTPAWADLNAIAEVYRNCPQGMEVDHIVPLQGRTVSGLHVHWNLQYLTKSENCRKGFSHA
jgi:hypothetical protein